MPKETIHDDRLLPGKDNSTQYAVDVNWIRDGIVQIATIDLQKEQYTEERGWHVDLTRDMINQLIKVLRKGRDQAYGADE
jgi:hypothetical protein